MQGFPQHKQGVGKPMKKRLNFTNFPSVIFCAQLKLNTVLYDLTTAIIITEIDSLIATHSEMNIKAIQ